MLDFDIDLKTSTVVKTTTASDTVVETIRVAPVESSGYRAKPVHLWNWSDLRDYIVHEVEQRHGAQVRDPKKEAGICKGFISRWGIEKAVAIAQAAFEVHGGMWRNAPITITRFTKNSDPYFAEIIAKSLI